MLSHLLLSLVAMACVMLVAGQGSPLDYAPSTAVECPDVKTQPLLRVFTPQTQAIHPQERAYIRAKEVNVLPQAWDAWVGNGSHIGYTSASFGHTFSRIGMAMSGGGFRAAQYGAAVLSGLDARNESAKASDTGGPLQVTSYMSALSGRES